jgi:NAD(P)-dependent dehydrogenase (short-subunit alcohol dehydrogenase family)
VAVEIDLSGRRALVTGAGQGIGRGIARTLAAAGAEVLVNDLVGERAEAVAAEIVADGGGASGVPFDVTDWTAVSAAVEGAGAIDVLVNNAGNAGKASTHGFEDMKPFAEEDPTAWEGFIRVNLFGVMYATRAVLPGMVERGFGRVVTVVSDSARTGEAQMAAYAAAKSGAAGLIRSIAREVGRHGVTANCLALGTMNPFEASPEDEEQYAWLVKRYAIRRRGLPADVAGITAFLASDMAEWITGQTIPVNGGYSMAL